MASWNPAASKVRRTADSLSAQGKRLHAFAEGGQRVGETVVAIDARDFFDEVDFALEIEAPTGQGDLPVASWPARIVERARSRGRMSTFFDGRGGDAFLVDGRAEDAVHFAEGERDGLAVGGAGFARGNAHVDEIAFDVAAVGEQNAADERRSDGAGVEVGAALEAMAGVGVQAVAARGAAHGHGLEPCGFDEHVRGGGRDHRVPAAHDAGEAERLWRDRRRRGLRDRACARRRRGS